MRKWQYTRKHHTQECQVVSYFPAGDHKACKEQIRQHNKKHETLIPKKLLEGLNIFNGTNLTLYSDVDWDRQMFGLHEDP